MAHCVARRQASARAGVARGTVAGRAVTGGRGAEVGQIHDQTCEREDMTYRCSEVAAEMLRSLIGDEEVTCDAVNRNRYGSTLRRRGVDLGSMMANAGSQMTEAALPHAVFAGVLDRAMARRGRPAEAGAHDRRRTSAT